MLVEPAVFRGDEGMHQFRWHLIESERDAAFLTVLGNKFAVRREDLHWCLQTDVFQRCHIGQLGRDIAVHAIYRGGSQQNATHCKDK
ncbi:hypothetical protein SODG_003516 [Sodalis praecaptivus]